MNQNKEGKNKNRNKIPYGLSISSYVLNFYAYFKNLE